MDLSIICPFVGEHPQILFTLQAVAQQFIGRIDFELIAIDNFIPNSPRVHVKENKSGEIIAAAAKINPWLKYVQYGDALSHWQAKRYGVSKSTGKHLLFVDAHVIPSRDSLYHMYMDYEGSGFAERGSMHLPLGYKILDPHRLIYKLAVDNECFYTYSFTGCPDTKEPFEVPCMSTCGMMISREIYDKLGGWPGTMGAYGGGENFMNFALAVCGYEKWIYPHGILYHHGEKRDYSQDYDETLYNRLLAHYLFGGKSLLDRFAAVAKGRPATVKMIANQAAKDGFAQRQLIKQSQKTSIEEWRAKWI